MSLFKTRFIRFALRHFTHVTFHAKVLKVKKTFEETNYEIRAFLILRKNTARTA
jgi:hypothetical protein